LPGPIRFRRCSRPTRRRSSEDAHVVPVIVVAGGDRRAVQPAARLEAVIACALLVLFTGVHLPLLFGAWPETGVTGIESVERVEALRLASLPLYAVTGALAVWHLRLIVERARAARWICLLTVLAIASTAWSISPEDTLRRSAALVMTILFALYLAARFDHPAQLRLLGIALTIAVMLGLAAAVVWPEVAIMHEQHPGALRGLFTNKNAFGHMAALDVIVLIACWVAEPNRRGTIGIAMSTALVALLLSESLAAALTVVAAAVAGLIVAGLRPHRGGSAHAAMLASVVILAMVVVAIVISWNLLALVERDPTLTGRTTLWAETWEFIRERPMLGYGYGAFWSEASDPVAKLDQALGWLVPSAHNGYIDLWLQLGLLGISLFVVAVLEAVLRFAYRVRLGEAAGVYATVLIGSGLLCRELAESSLLGQNDFEWLVLVMVLSSVDRIRQGRRPTSLTSD
jgi:exopolysaccharide production protein ExoQ